MGGKLLPRVSLDIFDPARDRENALRDQVSRGIKAAAPNASIQNAPPPTPFRPEPLGRIGPLSGPIEPRIVSQIRGSDDPRAD